MPTQTRICTPKLTYAYVCAHLYRYICALDCCSSYDLKNTNHCHKCLCAPSPTSTLLLVLFPEINVLQNLERAGMQLFITRHAHTNMNTLSLSVFLSLSLSFSLSLALSLSLSLPLGELVCVHVYVHVNVCM